MASWWGQDLALSEKDEKNNTASENEVRGRAGERHGHFSL